MGRVMGCGLCPYNAIEKVGNYDIATVANNNSYTIAHAKVHAIYHTARNS